MAKETGWGLEGCVELAGRRGDLCLRLAAANTVTSLHSSHSLSPSKHSVLTHIQTLRITCGPRAFYCEPSCGIDSALLYLNIKILVDVG